MTALRVLDCLSPYDHSYVNTPAFVLYTNFVSNGVMAPSQEPENGEVKANKETKTICKKLSRLTHCQKNYLISLILSLQPTKLEKNWFECHQQP